jgi:hypothetical protein
MTLYLLLFVEALPFLALVAFGVRELVLLDRLKKASDGDE